MALFRRSAPRSQLAARKDWSWLPLGAALCGVFATVVLCYIPPIAGTGQTFRWMVFVLGLLVSSLLYLSGALAQTERSRAKAAAWANAELQKQMAEREDLELAVRMVNERLEAVIQASPMAILWLDLQANIKRWNSSAERIFGWTEQEVIEKPLSALTGDAADSFQELIARVLQGELLEGVEQRRRRKDRGSVDVATWTAPCRDAGGNICGVLVTMADVTERKRLEQQLQHAQKLEAVGRLAGGVAHDFNNLLTIINGYSNVILEGPSLDPYLRAQIEEILKAGNRAASLTAQLLAFSRRQMIQPRALNLNNVVSNVERMLRRVIGENIECRVALDANLGLVKADPTQLEQIFINLAANARDAMPGGGVFSIETANVEITAHDSRRLGDVPPGSYVRIRVSDTGRGMDAETQKHVFEPFFTTKDVGKGTGLGLSSVYGSVKQNGGGISVCSAPGAGTTFSIYLPQVAGCLEEAGSACTRSQRGTETILLVEDEAPLRRLIRDVLVSSGYRVLEAGDGFEALRAWESQAGSIHLLLTDVVMPMLNGHEVAKRLKTRSPAMKVIYMSGHTDDVIAYHGILNSGTVLLQKPFQLYMLAAKVREVLDGHDATAALAALRPDTGNGAGLARS